MSAATKIAKPPTTPTRAEPSGPSIEETERGLDLDRDEGERLAHWARHHHVHAICGVAGEPISEAEARKLPDCPDCLRILRLYVDGHGWEGFGPKPGRDMTETLAWEVRRYIREIGGRP